MDYKMSDVQRDIAVPSLLSARLKPLASRVVTTRAAVPTASIQYVAVHQ